MSAIESKADDGADAVVPDADAASGYAFAAPATPFEYPSLSGANAERWKKWGLASARLVRLSITRGGRALVSEPDAFLRDLFASDALRAELPALAALAPRGGGELGGVVARPLRTTATSLSLFDALAEAGALREAADGSVFIPGRAEESWGGLAIVNGAREALCLPPPGDPDGEDPSGDAEALLAPNRYGDAFDAAARAEVLFCLARWVVAGGGMCQYEDVWAPYAAAVKDVARDVLTVVRGGDAGGGDAPRVVSAAWKVTAFAGGAPLFEPAADSPHSLCLVVADPVRRVVHVLYSAFVPWTC